MRQQMHKAVADVEKRANSIAALEAATSPIMETLAGIAIAGVILLSGYLVVERRPDAGRDHVLHHRAAARLRAGQAAGADPRFARDRAWSASA